VPEAVWATAEETFQQTLRGCAGLLAMPSNWAWPKVKLYNSGWSPSTTWFSSGLLLQSCAVAIADVAIKIHTPSKIFGILLQLLAEIGTF